jgi:hypothetical protein
MKVLVACEFSGTVRDAFIAKGHEALSCDLLPTESVGPHFQGNVLDIINNGWDLMIAHPPCTHLAVSGARHFKHKWELQKEALTFVLKLLKCSIPRICIENPVSVISSRIRKPTQIIHPWQFGVRDEKTTCLWLRNLPPLRPTKLVRPEFRFLRNGKRMSRFEYDSFFLPNDIRGHVRSITFKPIAEAMADQWGNLSTLPPLRKNGFFYDWY